MDDGNVTHKTITFLGDVGEDGHSKTTTHGETFIETVARVFEKDHPIVEKLSGHPLFLVEDGDTTAPAEKNTAKSSK